ncbi:hypothetical protein [Roseovarius Plymouth podovirus 1]|uniref:Uncharacterized protein n=2 Tax=Roseovarius Plymouth podovirus 1 TaxID=926474 RepID=K4Q4U9_9CAUD|nr:hypothetical protein HYO70_gp54 [Roseovarius Plymouth podovirus 1]CBW47047.1 hypothetical protein [Roseovarius sp. 217 phage 1]CBX87984.1 hypothetical protein [Roseovarius Plymouth podovirus 1]
MKKRIMNEYRIDTHFNGVIKAYFLTLKYQGWWRGYEVVHEELIYEGHLEKEAHTAIDKRITKEKGEEVKWSRWKDDRGEAPTPEWL